MTLSLIITLVVGIIGFIFAKDFLWIPISGLVASIIDKYVRNWVQSGKLGIAVNISTLIKFVLSLIMLYATLSMIAAIVLLFVWFL